MSTEIPLATRSSSGITVIAGPPSFKNLDAFKNVESKLCRSMLFSPEGDFLVYLNDSRCVFVSTKTWTEEVVIQPCKAYQITFSPKGTYLLTWEPFTVSNANPNGSPNLHIYETKTGKLVKSFEQKKQVNWQPQWSSDEKLFTRLVNTDIVFYEDVNFDKIVNRLKCYKVRSYGLSPNPGTYFFICHTPGGPGQPTFGRLYKYPKVDTPDAIANKSFFQADKVDYLWNSKGNNCLLLTSTEVDKTGGSYYGKQGLHFVSVTGQTLMVTMSKEGPIYSVEWSPKNTEFCVVYGFMPPKATIFNLKCEPIFELGSGPYNSIYYNPQANILLLGGFGNVSTGNIIIWDTKNWKQISTCEAPDTTLLEWSPDGTHFLTATTAPRLRVNNGYKIWHFSGSLLHEKACVNEELAHVEWKKFPKYTFKEPITTEKVEGITSSQPQASKLAYVPPSLRNRPARPNSDNNEKPHKPGGDSTPSKATLKQKKKREAKKAKKQTEENENDGSPSITSSVQVNLTGDPELDKKLKNIKKKLDAIEKLKDQQAQGKPLQTNQLAKIQGEHDLLKELEQLQV